MTDHADQVILTLPAAAYDKFVEACENPPQAPEELKSLFREMSPFLHPAEAAGRENGTSALEKICAAIVTDPQPLSDTKLIERIYQIASTALSTHQQQGADSFLIERLREAAANPNDIGCYIGAGDLIAAANALSRAPQPDTVTEEMRQAAFKELAACQHAAISKEGRILDATETVDVILAAALAARGKV